MMPNRLEDGSPELARLACEWRERHNATQVELSVAAGVSPTSVRRIERALPVTMKTRKAVARIVDADQQGAKP